VHLPLFVYELKDLPMMLKHVGDLLHGIKSVSGLSPVKEAAASTLAYQFGWAPLLQDLGRLIDFSAAVKRRQTELEKAHSKTGLRRRISLGTDNNYRQGKSYIWSSYGLTARPTWRTHESAVTWAVVWWKVRDPSQIGRKPTFNEAYDTALGLNPGHIPIQIWKALPWSWMIDWFTDISNVMTANYNLIYYKPSRLAVMRTSTSICRHNRMTFGTDGVISAGTMWATYKDRWVNNSPSAAPVLKLPFIDNFKLSILGSLSILRISGMGR